MESLNLNMLAKSLPNSNLANAEKDLMNNFKAAALSITTLYRSSRRTSKRAYNAGYAAACQDLLLMIQQGVSAGESSDLEGGGMSIGRIMDYIEARLEAIKSREEEEDEDEEKDKDRERGRTGAAGTVPPAAASAGGRGPGITKTSSVPAPSHPTTRPRENAAPGPPTSQIPSNHHQNHIAQSPPPSASLPSSPLAPVRPHSVSIPQNLLSQRQPKGRLFAPSNTKESTAISTSEFNPPSATQLPPGDAVFNSPAPIAVISPPTFPSASSPISDHPTGTKRRHTAMLLDSVATPNASPLAPSAAMASSSNRRRTRSSRSAAQGLSQHQDHNYGQGPDAMDIEDDGGRERKRVARR